MLLQRLMLATIFLLFSFQIQGCIGTQTQSTSQERLLVKCEEPRPEICTLQYTPVCGYSDKAMATYSNSCSACAERSVIGYSDGVCL